MIDPEEPIPDDRRNQKGRKKYDEEAKQVGFAREGLERKSPMVSSKRSTIEMLAFIIISTRESIMVTR
jgi:hypothetical protein